MDDTQAMTSALAEMADQRHYGKYRGRVVSNRDPQSLARLQVEVPSLLGEGTQVWALACVPYAGSDVGWFFLPPVGAAVWVEFEAGDLDYPIWSGCFWPDNQSPPEGGSDPDTKVLKTDAVTIKIDDRAGEIVIETRGGTKLTLDATEMKGEALTITQEAATGKLVLSATGLDVNNGAFTVI